MPFLQMTSETNKSSITTVEQVHSLQTMQQSFYPNHNNKPHTIVIVKDDLHESQKQNDSI